MVLSDFSNSCLSVISKEFFKFVVPSSIFETPFLISTIALEILSKDFSKDSNASSPILKFQSQVKYFLLFPEIDS